MLLKKHKTGLEYVKFSDGSIISNPFSKHQSFDLGEKPLFEDIRIMTENALINQSLKGGMRLELPMLSKKPIAIFSDGVDFLDKHEELVKNLNEWLIIATNGCLNKWKAKRKPDYLLCINPFEDSLLDLPSVGIVRPPLLASLKTNYNFIKSYGRTTYFFSPPAHLEFKVPNIKKLSIIEDYRTPIGCAINISVKANIDKILLAFVDESFVQNRAGSISNKDGTFCYKPQKKVNIIIDGLNYWIKKNNRELFYFGRGLEINDIREFEITK